MKDFKIHKLSNLNSINRYPIKYRHLSTKLSVKAALLESMATVEAKSMFPSILLPDKGLPPINFKSSGSRNLLIKNGHH